MVKFWYGAFFASVVFVAVWFVWGGQVNPNSSTAKNPPLEALADQPTNQTDSLSRAPNAAGTEALLNGKIFKIKNADQVAGAIKEIQEYASAHPEDNVAQIYSNFVNIIPMFKGIAWRLRFLVEPVDAAYIASISYLRVFKRNSDRRPDHINAIFDYLVDPNPNDVIEGQKGYFTSAAQFQDFMAEKVAPAVKKQIEKYELILKAHGNDNVELFKFDAALILDVEPGMQFVSTTNQMRKYMPGNLKGLIANMYEKMGFGYYIASYDLEKLQAFINTLTARSLVAKKAKVDAKTRAGNMITSIFDVHLQSPKEISQVLQNPSFAKFLTLRPEATMKDKEYLKKSLTNIRNAVNYRVAAYKAMEAQPKKANQNEYFADADYLTSRPAISLTVLNKRKELVDSNAPYKFQDRVDGRNFEIYLVALFNPNSPTVKDLKKLYPKQFDQAKKETDGGPRETFKWNYDYGTPQAWPDHTFGGLLPGTKDSAEYRKKLVSISRDASTPALQYWLRLFM